MKFVLIGLMFSAGCSGNPIGPAPVAPPVQLSTVVASMPAMTLMGYVYTPPSQIPIPLPAHRAPNDPVPLGTSGPCGDVPCVPWIPPGVNGCGDRPCAPDSHDTPQLPPPGTGGPCGDKPCAPDIHGPHAKP